MFHLFQCIGMTWVDWEKEMRTKLSKVSFYKEQKMNDQGGLDIENLDITFLTSILLNKRAQPEEAKRCIVILDQSIKGNAIP